jgi:hypothetical protein
MNARTGRSRILLAAIAAALALAATAPAGAPAADFSVGTDCQEQQAFVDGDPAAVAARLPERYTPVRNPASGRPLVFARGLRCAQVALGGRSAPVINASYGVVVESPDGRGCGSGAPTGSVKGDVPPVCNWYVLAWLSNDASTVAWLRDGTPGFPAFHVRQMVFDLGASEPMGGAPFTFTAAGPSPYVIEGVAHESPREIAVRGGYWTDTPQGTVKLALSSDDLRAGDADGTVRATRGTELATLLGADEASFSPGFTAFSTVRARQGIYRKQVISSSGNGDAFAGSCSVQGSNKFDPPATNTSQPLAYEFNGSGTCTGKLNGRDVTNAPVRAFTGGRSEGGCRSARTTTPGQGRLVFDSGELVRYTFDFTSNSTEIDGTAYGERSGTADLHASFATQRTNPTETSAQCGGAGVREAPMDLTLTTETPLVSEPPPVAHPGTRGRLSVAVTPRSARTGQSTRFTFRVTAAGRPVPGAAVRFAGRRVRTGRTGTARITATFGRPGPRKVRAADPGFRVGRASVTIRR